MSGNNKVLTLVFVRRPGDVLLGMKKRGFGTGLYNGFGWFACVAPWLHVDDDGCEGGKVEPGETILQGAVREVQEVTCHLCLVWE
jgi:hypothetical protein